MSSFYPEDSARDLKRSLVQLDANALLSLPPCIPRGSNVAVAIRFSHLVVTLSTLARPIVQAVVLTVNWCIRGWNLDHWLKRPRRRHLTVIQCYRIYLTSVALLKIRRHIRNMRRRAQLMVQMVVSPSCCFEILSYYLTVVQWTMTRILLIN